MLNQAAQTFEKQHQKQTKQSTPANKIQADQTHDSTSLNKSINKYMSQKRVKQNNHHAFTKQLNVNSNKHANVELKSTQ